MTPRIDLICTVPRPHLLGRALIWPGYFGAVFLGLFGLYPSSLSKSTGFVSLSGKASVVSISDAIIMYDLSMFVFRSNFVEKKCVGKRAWRPRWHLVPPTLIIIIV